MSVAELPPTNEPEPAQVPEEEAPADVAVAPISPIRQVCEHCRRPVYAEDIDGVVAWRHWDPRVDMPQNPAFCLPELYEPPQVAWGHLDVRGKLALLPQERRSGGMGGMAA